MNCRLCLNKSENYIGFFEFEGLSAEAASIVGKHFWFEPKPDDSNSIFICKNCWIILKDFHELYTQVENAHKSLVENVSVKVDSDNVKGEILDQNHLPDRKEDFTDNIDWNCLGFDKLDDEVKSEDSDNNREDSCHAIERDHKDSDKTPEIESSTLKRKKRGRPPTKKSKVRKELTNEQDTETPETKTKTIKKNDKKKTREEKAASDSRFNEEDRMIIDFLKMTCDICSIEERNFSYLKRHFKSVHKQDGFITCCNKKFYKRSWLVDHIGKHINPNSFKCSFCDRTCNSRRTLRGHIERMHKSHPANVHQCSICGKGFKHGDILVRHSLTHVPEEDRKFKCHCGKTYPTQSLLNQHIRIIHDKRYAGTCDICGKTYNNKEDVNRHRMIVHEGAEKSKVKCKICSKEFPTKYQYYNHRVEEHGDPNNKVDNRCEFCNKISANSEALKRHVEKVHKRIPKFKCTFCEKLFKTELSLKEHMATHTGEPLYVCPHCPKTFTHNANMHHHRKQAHPLEFEEARQWKLSKKQSWTQLTSITN